MKVETNLSTSAKVTGVKAVILTMLALCMLYGPEAFSQAQPTWTYENAAQLLLEQAEVPVKGYWVSGAPMGVALTDGRYSVAQTYTYEEVYRVFGTVEFHRYVDIKIDLFEDEVAARTQYEKIRCIYGKTMTVAGRPCFVVDIQSGSARCCYFLLGSMCVGIVTNDSFAVMESFADAFFAHMDDLESDGASVQFEGVGEALV